MDGIVTRKKLFENVSRYGRHIPFILLTNGTHHTAIKDAYAASVQGVFLKPAQLTSLQNLMKTIIDYWLIAVYE
jgi:DNA-binding NarL/FixJ family response regulator